MWYCGSKGGLWGGCHYDIAADTEVSEDDYFVGCDEVKAEKELVATIKGGESYTPMTMSEPCWPIFVVCFFS